VSILVVGLGNPILGDDGVGWRVADEVERRVDEASVPVEIERLALGGLSLMERLIGYDHVVLIDALATGDYPVGTVRRLRLQDLPDPSDGYTTAAHDTSLQTALEVGRRLGMSLPPIITVVAVETAATFEFSDNLSPPVETAVEVAASLVLELLSQPTAVSPTGRQEGVTHGIA
jgi:hydrogenase maturation protease